MQDCSYPISSYTFFSPVRKAPLSLEDADVGLNADIFRLPMRSNGGKTVFHVGKTEVCHDKIVETYLTNLIGQTGGRK